jgi:hypothetical protein
LALKFLEVRKLVSKEVKAFCLQNKTLPQRFLTADDLIAIGIKPGKDLGRFLEEVFDAQLEGAVKNRGEALQWVQARK